MIKCNHVPLGLNNYYPRGDAVVITSVCLSVCLSIGITENL